MAVNISGLNNKAVSPKPVAATPVKAPVTPAKSVAAPPPKPVVPAVTVAIKSAVVAAPKPPAVVAAKAPVAPTVSKPAAAVSKPVVTPVKAPVVTAAKAAVVSKPVVAAPVKAPVAAAKSVATKPATTVAVNQPKTEANTYNKAGGVGNSNAVSKSSSVSDTGGFIAGKGDVVIDIKASDSGYENKIYYSTDNFKTKNYVGIDNKTGSVNIGSFKEGTKIEFGIENGERQSFRTGGASANFDNFQHTKTTELSDGAVQIGFEDLAGGGDKDFNDAIIEVRNVPTAKTNDNRSGLGDGTNPGQGAGRANSPNQGTNNPSALNL